MSHRGPFQQFTEVCLACGHNSYETDICDGPLGRADIERKDRKARARADFMRVAERQLEADFEEFWRRHGS